MFQTETIIFPSETFVLGTQQKWFHIFLCFLSFIMQKVIFHLGFQCVAQNSEFTI